MCTPFPAPHLPQTLASQSKQRPMQLDLISITNWYNKCSKLRKTILRFVLDDRYSKVNIFILITIKQICINFKLIKVNYINRRGQFVKLTLQAMFLSNGYMFETRNRLTFETPWVFDEDAALIITPLFTTKQRPISSLKFYTKHFYFNYWDGSAQIQIANL